MPSLISSDGEEDTAKPKNAKSTEAKSKAVRKVAQLVPHLEELLDDELIEMDVTDMVLKVARGDDTQAREAAEDAESKKAAEAEQYKQTANDLLAGADRPFGVSDASSGVIRQVLTFLRGEVQCCDQVLQQGDRM